MAASVLNTRRAVEVSLFVIRAFVNLRKISLESKEIARQITRLDKLIMVHDEQIHRIIKTLKELIKPDLPPKRNRIGF